MQNAKIEAAIRNHETAYRMQSAVPELCDLSNESQATQKLYKLNSNHASTAAYCRQCLLALGTTSCRARCALYRTELSY